MSDTPATAVKEQSQEPSLVECLKEIPQKPVEFDKEEFWDSIHTGLKELEHDVTAKRQYYSAVALIAMRYNTSLRQRMTADDKTKLDAIWERAYHLIIQLLASKSDNPQTATIVSAMRNCNFMPDRTVTIVQETDDVAF